MRVTLIRHTEVDEKYHKCYNGHIDIGLSKRGHKQAKELANHFNAHAFDSIFCSDLIRTKETLSKFTQKQDVVYTKKLREKSWGKHEGLTFEAIISQNEISYESFIQWINALDGEPYEQYIQRVREFFLEFLPSLRKENILVVTHAGVIRVFMHIINNLTLEEAFSISIPYSSYIVYDAKIKSFSDVKLIEPC